jgi:uncharacterized protein YjbJ (UPF0337 family)
MNWTQIEGKWDQFKGKARAQWGKLSDDDLTNLQGKREQLLGKLVERYGVAKDEAEKQVNSWLSKLQDHDTKGDS